MSLASPNPALTGSLQHPHASLTVPEILDAASTMALKEAAIKAASHGPIVVLLDLSGVRSIDASAVAGLLELLRAVRSRGGDMRLHGASPVLDAVQLQAHLGQIARIYANRHQAISGGSLQRTTLRRYNNHAHRSRPKPWSLNWIRRLIRS